MDRTTKDIDGFEIIETVDRSKLLALRESIFRIIDKHIPLGSDNIEVGSERTTRKINFSLMETSMIYALKSFMK